MVILRCLTCLYPNLFKSYDTKHQKHKNSKNTNLTKLVNSCKNIFKYFQAFLWIPQWITEIHRPSISHFKAFGMTNLQYEIRNSQKIDRRVIIHYCAWYDFLRNRRYSKYSQKLGEDFAKFCGLLRIYELYPSVAFEKVMFLF